MPMIQRTNDPLVAQEIMADGFGLDPEWVENILNSGAMCVRLKSKEGGVSLAFLNVPGGHLHLGQGDDDPHPSHVEALEARFPGKL